MLLISKVLKSGQYGTKGMKNFNLKGIYMTNVLESDECQYSKKCVHDFNLKGVEKINVLISDSHPTKCVSSVCESSMVLTIRVEERRPGLIR